MSVTRTFTVTVQSTGSGNKYFIDGVQTPTLTLGEGGTYKFDQSDSTNGTHPLRFATAADAAGGTQYTTGVTTNGTPGNSGAYTQIVVAASAPDLYYYCTNHGGMGGQANTVDGNSWGIFPWNVNEYGDQDSIDLTLTGVSATSSVGSVEAFNEEGWGRQEWGNSGWGVEYAVQLTGQQVTSSTGSITTEIAVPLTGLSTTSALGSLTLALESIITPTGQQATTELGDFDNAGTLVGWGRNGWGEEPWGDSWNKLVQPAGLSAVSSVGDITPPQFAFGLTGVEATSTIGTLGLEFGASTEPITGVSATSTTGNISIGIGVPLTGVSATSNTGSVTIGIGVPLTGLEATSQIGELEQSSSPILQPTGFELTSSTGTFTIVDMQIGLSGLGATSSVGSIDLPDATIGLIGQELEISLNGTGISPLYYNRLTPKVSTGYTIKTPA